MQRESIAMPLVYCKCV